MTHRPRNSRPRTVLMLGAAGGVGRATLALLKGHPLGQALVPGIDELLLLDGTSPPDAASLGAPLGARWLAPTQLSSRADLLALLHEHEVDEVIELAAVSTWDCISACAEAGASYLTTSYDTWIGTELEDPDDAHCMLRSRAMFSPPDIAGGVHMMCMGMNPGLINILVARGLQAFAERASTAPSLAALDLHSIVLTELDETTLAPPSTPAPDHFACTWCPEGCLDEVLEPQAMIIVDGEITPLDHAPHQARYQARCGDRMIHGHLVPHEELVTLSAMYPIDLAYCYRMPAAADRALASAPQRRPDDWQTERLYPPDHLDDLRGFNRVGALLCSHTHGELWIGWQTPMAAALPYQTNATLLQVAAGLLAGWHELRAAEPGIYLPEELDTARVLEQAASILGPPQVQWYPDAPARRIAERRVEG